MLFSIMSSILTKPYIKVPGTKRIMNLPAFSATSGSWPHALIIEPLKIYNGVKIKHATNKVYLALCLYTPANSY